MKTVPKWTTCKWRTKRCARRQHSVLSCTILVKWKIQYCRHRATCETCLGKLWSCSGHRARAIEARTPARWASFYSVTPKVNRLVGRAMQKQNLNYCHTSPTKSHSCDKSNIYSTAKRMIGASRILWIGTRFWIRNGDTFKTIKLCWRCMWWLKRRMASSGIPRSIPASLAWRIKALHVTWIHCCKRSISQINCGRPFTKCQPRRTTARSRWRWHCSAYSTIYNSLTNQWEQRNWQKALDGKRWTHSCSTMCRSFCECCWTKWRAKWSERAPREPFHRCSRAKCRLTSNAKM